MSDVAGDSKAVAIARAVGAAMGTYAAKSGLVAAEAAHPTIKHRLPRKLKKALKKAQAVAQEV